MRETLALALFACFFFGTLTEIVLMLVRKRQGAGLDRFRLIFFFLSSLMLVCLLPLWIFGELSTVVWVSDLTVVLANAIGLGLTYTREGQGGSRSGSATRAYTFYFQGKPLGMVTRAGFEQLMSNELLKKQRTVELVDDYQEKARRQGLKVLIYQNKDGSQRLIKVESPDD